MAATKRAFVSDIHMGGEWSRAAHGGHDWSWLSAQEADDFAAFLAHVGASGEYKELVILGDCFDDWVWPAELLPPTFAEIAAAPKNAKAVAALRALCAGGKVRVVLMPGNHDMTITAGFLAGCFPGIVFGGPGKHDSVYRTSRLRAEHGSAYALFNAPDPYNNPGSRLPLGYYISRVVATRAHRTGSDARRYATYVDDLFEVVGPQALAACTFEAVLEEAELTAATEFKVRLADGSVGAIAAREVKAKYARLFDQWVAGRGFGRAVKAITAEIGRLGNVADSLCKKGDTNVVIFGHSHDWDLDKDSWFVDDRIYANCGSWCDPRCPHTFVETEKDEKARRHVVRVIEWKGGATKILAEESVPL